MDFMETGSIIPLPNGWFLDTETMKKFRIDDDGNVIGEDGEVIVHGDDDDR